MFAWRGHAYGPPKSLVWEEVADPPLSEGQARIEVRASAVNYPDVLYVAGTYQVKPTPPFIPGFEVAGVVIESDRPSFPSGRGWHRRSTDRAATRRARSVRR